ncbi:MAG: response regulator, partial [Deltaproteobacteria bacterium]|nr:response regulator [Deltaproteobacteria bacterium]
GSFDIKPSAFAGIEREAMDGLVVKWDESEYGNGVTGRAIKTGKVQVVQDTEEDPMSRPWHEFARRTGYQSTCSLPLMIDDRVIGALNVHSGEENAFHDEELELLEEVTADIAYAISAIKERNRRRQAEEALRESEAQLQQVTKMEAIAILAGGVAHEFNNALMGIMGNIELLKMDLPKDERRDKYFGAMKGSSHRMSRLTAQLLAYAEGGKYQPKDLKLDEFVIETLPILQHDLNPEVRVETHFPKDISYIKADYAQMQMVLSAILANSNEAIEDDGLIRITAENKDVGEDFTKQHPGLKPGPYVCLTIEDDGEGMDEETKDGIFEPFFTTKFQGRGMGMAAVYGIIKGHDGAITVESEPGKGTVVRIYLPAISVESKEQEAKAVKQPEVEIAMGEGTILIIEDEEPLVDLFREILEILGYRALLARTGKEAVELAKTFDGQIDLALLDIKLPDMDGGRVYPLIMEARPDLKVIVCSGYSIHGPAQAILDAGAEGFIQKPFSIAPFAEKLKEVLDAG